MPSLPVTSRGQSTSSSSQLPDLRFFFLPSNFCFLSSSVSTQVVFMPAASHSLGRVRDEGFGLVAYLYLQYWQFFLVFRVTSQLLSLMQK